MDQEVVNWDEVLEFCKNLLKQKIQIYKINKNHFNAEIVKIAHENVKKAENLKKSTDVMRKNNYWL